MSALDEAVEAAARTFPGYTPEHEADDLEREINAACRSRSRLILEAAAPFIAARAWDASAQEAAMCGWMHHVGAADMKLRNPYREAQA